MLYVLILWIPHLQAAALSTDRTEFFSGEEARVRVEARLPKGSPPPKLVRDDRGRVKVVAVLNDNGVFGDRRAGDGVFSRSVLFKENLAKTIRLRLENDAKDGPETVALTVKARPNLLEIISSLWGRWWTRMLERFRQS